MLADPFGVVNVIQRVIRQFRLCLIHRCLCLAFWSMHVVTLGGITMLRGTIHRNVNLFFSSFDPLPLGSLVVTEGGTLLYSALPNVFGDAHFGSSVLLFNFVPKCLCSYQILKYLKLNSFYEISR